MPWMESGPMEQREQFVRAAMRGDVPFAWLCDEARISRKTGYKWLKRFEDGGRPALSDQSRAAHSCPHRTAAAVEARVLGLRKAQHFLGPRQLLCKLMGDPGLAGEDLPAPSTIAKILKRNGMVEPQRRHRRWARPQLAPAATEPNELWTMDHKGHFVVGNKRVLPLTVTDAASRKLIVVEPVKDTSVAEAQKWLTWAFLEYGMPVAVQSDNGVPFGSAGLGGLSRLSVWLIRNGVTIYRSRPGHPTDNASHERMHATMVREALWDARMQDDPRGHLRRWKVYFNSERPHQALGMRTPDQVWNRSPREMPRVLPEMQYPGWYEVRRVRKDGSIKLRGEHVYVSEALAGELVGLELVDDGVYWLHFGPLTLATINRENRLMSRLERPERPPREPILPHGEG